MVSVVMVVTMVSVVLEEVVAVERVEWSVERCLSSSTPLLLLNSPASLWPALRWTPPLLQRYSKEIFGVKMQREEGRFEVGCCEVIPMNMVAVWEIIQHLENRTYLYLSTSLNNMAPVLKQQILDSPMFLDHLEEYASSRQINVWMGNAGSSAALHHDPFHNFFVQIMGT